MKIKEIGLVVASAAVLIVSLYFIYNMLFASSNNKSNTASSKVEETQAMITGNVDEHKDTLTKVKAYKDYGGASLENIGRVNPFGPLN